MKYLQCYLGFAFLNSGLFGETNSQDNRQGQVSKEELRGKRRSEKGPTDKTRIGLQTPRSNIRISGDLPCRHSAILLLLVRAGADEQSMIVIYNWQFNKLLIKYQ